MCVTTLVFSVIKIHSAVLEMKLTVELIDTASSLYLIVYIYTLYENIPLTNNV